MLVLTRKCTERIQVGKNAKNRRPGRSRAARAIGNRRRAGPEDSSKGTHAAVTRQDHVRFIKSRLIFSG